MTDQLPMQIAFASDANYFDGLAVALTSVLKHTSGMEGAHIHILDGGLKLSQRRFLARVVSRRGNGIELTFHDLALENPDSAKLKTYSEVSFARLLLPELLKEARTTLYLDVDVYYGADLRELWDAELNGTGVAAICDSIVRLLGHDCTWLEADSPDAKNPYFNAGVLKIDLDYWRQHEIGTTTIALVRQEPEKCKYWEQTALNYVLKNSVTWIPEHLNFQITRENLIDSGVLPCAKRNLHFITQPKPWARHSRRHTFKYWRAGYAAEVSRWPKYMLKYDYWATFVWCELLQKSRAFIPTCRLLLASHAYRVIPGLTAATLNRYLTVPSQPWNSEDSQD